MTVQLTPLQQKVDAVRARHRTLKEDRSALLNLVDQCEKEFIAELATLLGEQPTDAHRYEVPESLAEEIVQTWAICQTWNHQNPQSMPRYVSMLVRRASGTYWCVNYEQTSDPEPSHIAELGQNAKIVLLRQYAPPRP